MTRSTKLLAALMAGTLYTISPAHACQGIQFETSVFYHTMPTPADDSDPETNFIGEISLKQKPVWFSFKQDNENGFTAFVHKSPTHPELEGTRINVFPVFGTSCGPWLDDGDRGFVSARMTVPDGGQAWLTLNAHGFDIYGQPLNE